jgi:XRE family transcriptional regulator, regulator of sulfur utilization
VLRNLAAKIKDLRKAKDWSQEELSERAHLHRTYIAEIETGKRNPSLRSLIKIANAFRIPVGDLLSSG